jgi:aminoglycoside phosphotransferase family enzyme
VTTEKGNEMTEVEKRCERRARKERIDRLLEEARELLRKNEAIFDRWRAEGILPPEEPRRRF